MIGPMLRVLVLTLVLLVAVMFVTAGLRRPLPQPELATYLETPLGLPQFALQDTNGEPFTTQSLRGHFSLLFFGFTNCPDICPLTLAALASASEALDEDTESAPEVVFVSVDPNRDTPARIAAYLDGFDSRFVGVTSNRAGLDPLLRALGVMVMIHAVPGRDDYAVTHNGTIFMVGPNAELIATLGGSPTPTEIANDFRRVRQLYRRRLASPPGA